MKSFVLISAMLVGIVQADPLPLVPLPVSVKPADGVFGFSSATAIRYDRRLKGDADLFAADLQARTGVIAKTVAKELKIFLPSEILLDIDASADVPAGGYKLVISPKTVVVTGKDAAGVYYGTRSLLQLLPVMGDEVWKKSQPVSLPALQIVDYPRYAWRGMMLDVGRHFYPAEDVKHFIDWMAFHKLNVFHWHLTEDQGWRIEIKKYPKLTEVGAWRDSSPPYGNRNGSDGVRHGGFYTQAQIKEIVAYASARHITIVPEIEMPGHASAAITAYPQFGNSDVPGYAPTVQTHWGVHPYIFAPKEETFHFLEDILTEVCELFPSQYIHIGGDEAPKDQWKKSKVAQDIIKREHLKDEFELQSWFVRRIGKFLESKGRRLIGWDEIQEGGLPKTATMMVWRDTRWAKHALALGNNVVMAPNSHTYFDHYQLPAASELAKGKDYECIGGHLPIETVYSFNPSFVVESPAQEKQVLGVQAQLWSEYFKDMKKVEYMAFPRIAALAEISWTPLASKNYDNFLVRLGGVMKHYDAGHLAYPKPMMPAKREAKEGAKLETSLGTYQNHWPELAYDGRADTFFWADRALRVDDHFTLHLSAPLAAAKEMKIVTGGDASHNGDKLEHGVLEVSANGSTWTKLADFTDGQATATVPAGTASVRFRVTAPQKNWLIIHEIAL